jgi:hypothetical protein
MTLPTIRVNGDKTTGGQCVVPRTALVGVARSEFLKFVSLPSASSSRRNPMFYLRPFRQALKFTDLIEEWGGKDRPVTD